MKTAKSEQLYKTACGFMPGGVNSPVRACKAVGTVPLFIDHAKVSFVLFPLLCFLLEAEGHLYRIF